MINLLRKSSPVIAWAIAALALVAVTVWTLRQVNDPLSTSIPADKMQHIIAFAVLGLVAALTPSAPWRIGGLAITMTLAVVVELMQAPIPDRTASLSDLLASIVGGFAGFGFGAAAAMALALVRSRISARERAPASPET